MMSPKFHQEGPQEDHLEVDRQVVHRVAALQEVHRVAALQKAHHEAALRGQGACSCDQSCTQEQRDVCAEHHTVSMAFHAPTLPVHRSNGHG